MLEALALVLGGLSGLLSVLLWHTQRKLSDYKQELQLTGVEADALRIANGRLEEVLKECNDELQALYEQLAEHDPSAAMDRMFGVPRKTSANN